MQESFYHTLSNGMKCKFTIRDRMIGDELFYYVNLINIDLEIYSKLSDLEKEHYFGMEITDGNQRAINYRDATRLKNDIITKYGNEWLITEK